MKHPDLSKRLRRGATVLLCIGLLGSVMSTMVSQCLVSGYVITDILKWDADLTSKKFKIAEFIVTLFGVAVPLIGWNAFAVSSYGSGFNLTFFPIVLSLIHICGASSTQASKPRTIGKEEHRCQSK